MSNPDFFDKWGWLELFCLAAFPRLTLLIGSFATGGLLWWAGWLACPHLLVAILAIPYFDTKPFLVVLAWMLALGGTTGEACAAKNA